MNKKRLLSLFVENDVGVLAEIAGLFAGKAYNLDSLTVGVTADKTVSRMTICLTSDDAQSEQTKKQLNRKVNVIRVADMTDTYAAEKELAFIKLSASAAGDARIATLAARYGLQILATGSCALLQSVNPRAVNDELTVLLTEIDPDVEIVRGGSVAI